MGRCLQWNDETPLIRLQGPLLVFGGAYSNLEATQALFAELAGRLCGCASTRLWPSLDVLPETERRATGAPLDVSDMFWPKGLKGEPHI